MYYLTIDKTSTVAIYKQIEEGILKALQTKLLRAHDVLPKEDDLCDFFNISRTVVRQAYQSLEDQGVLYRVKGKGTFVSTTSHIQFTHNDILRLDKVVLQKKAHVQQSVIFTDHKKVLPSTALAVDFPIHSLVTCHAHVLTDFSGPILYVEDIFHQKIASEVQRSLQLHASPFDELMHLCKGATMTIAIEEALGPMVSLLKLDMPDTLMRIKIAFVDAIQDVIILRQYVASGKNVMFESIIEEVPS